MLLVAAELDGAALGESQVWWEWADSGQVQMGGEKPQGIVVSEESHGGCKGPATICYLGFLEQAILKGDWSRAIPWPPHAPAPNKQWCSLKCGISS